MQAPDKIVLQTAPPAKAGQPEREITLSEVFNRMAGGQTAKAIMRNDPAIRPETIILARAFMLAQDPGLALQADIAAARSHDFKILVDENINPEVVKALIPIYGVAISVQKAGLKGKKDPEVWQWAVDNHCDAILTQDTRQKNDKTDLTLIAENAGKKIIAATRAAGADREALAELPVIIHYHKKDGAKLMPALNKIISGFENEIKTRMVAMTRPRFEITPKGIVDGPTYTALMNSAARLPAPDAWEASWRARIANQNSQLDPAQKKKINEMVRTASLLRASAPPPAPTPPARKKGGRHPA